MTPYIEFISNHPYLFMALFIVTVLIIKAEIDNRLSGGRIAVHVESIFATK